MLFDNLSRMSNQNPEVSVCVPLKAPMLFVARTKPRGAVVNVGCSITRQLDQREVTVVRVSVTSTLVINTLTTDICLHQLPDPSHSG